MKANQEKQNNVKANQVSNNATATDATATATAEKVVKNTEKYLKDNTKPTDVKRDINGFKDGGTKIATATAVKFEKLGKFIAKFQAIEAKDGGKTVYIFETAEKVFVGYTSSELSDVFGLEKRCYKKSESDNNTPSDNSTIIALRALKESIDKLNKIEKYKKMFEVVNIAEVEKAITEERGTQEAMNAFVTKESDKIELSKNYKDESILIEDLGKLFVNQLKEYGLGFYAPKESTEETKSTEDTKDTKDTKDSDNTKDTDNSDNK